MTKPAAKRVPKAPKAAATSASEASVQQPSAPPPREEQSLLERLTGDLLAAGLHVCRLLKAFPGVTLYQAVDVIPAGRMGDLSVLSSGSAEVANSAEPPAAGKAAAGAKPPARKAAQKKKPVVLSDSEEEPEVEDDR